MTSALRALVCVSLLTALPLTARAAPRTTDRLAVLPIVLEGPHGSATISSIFNDVAAATEMRVHLRVVSYEEMFAASEEGLGDRVRDCGSDTACVSARLRAFNARLGLVVVIDFSSKPPILSLQLLDTDDAKMLANSVGEIAGGNALSESIRDKTRAVLERAGYTRAGRVLVEVSPPNARVSIPDMEPDPGTPNRFTVAPGTYRVSAALDGYSATNGEVTVDSGAEAKLQLSLTKESAFYESPWLWVVVGVVAAGAITTAAVVTHEPDHFLCVTLHDMNPACPD